MDRTTLLQFFLPSAIGGLDVPDPLVLADTASLASVADSLPTLSRNPLLTRLIRDHHSWPTSPSIDLRDSAASFSSILSLPQASVLAVDSRTFQFPPAISLLYDATAGAFSLAQLACAARHHLQRAATAIFLSHLRDVALALPHPPHIAARLRATATPHANAILLVRSLPPSIRVPCSALAHFFCHRFGIPLTAVGLTLNQLASCTALCSQIPHSRPITADHRLAYSLPHAYHQAGCGVGKLRTDRHDAISAVAADGISVEGPFRVDLKKNLGSSTTRGTKVDFLLTANYLFPSTTAFDTSVTCSLTTSYLSAAASDAHAVFRERAAEKAQKHLTGSLAQGRAFLPFILNTFGGIGPRETVEWFDNVFARSAQRERAAGGSGRSAADRRILYYAAIHAALIRSTSRMVYLRVTSSPAADATDDDPPATTSFSSITPPSLLPCS